MSKQAKPNTLNISQVPDQEVQFMRAVLRARRDPVWFAREILQLRALDGEPTLDQDPANSWELDAWQVEMLESCADVWRREEGMKPKFNAVSNMITVAACQGPGKTFGAAMLMHWFGFCFEGLQVCTAPKLQQVTTRLFREFEKIRQRALPGYQQMIEVGATKIQWLGRPRWYAIAETGRSPESLQGFHDKYILIIVDEASGVPDEMFAVMRGAMSSGKVAIALLIGNPTQILGTFADSHRRADLAGDYYRMQVSYLNSKRVKRSWVEQMARQYGVASPIYKVRCLGEFTESDVNQLIPLSWLAQARLKDEINDGSLPRLRVTVDVADGGIDETVVTVARHHDSGVHMVAQRVFNFPPSESPLLAAEAAAQMFNAYGGRKNEDDIVVDALGVGAGTAGHLMRLGYSVITYKGGEASDDPSMWRCRRVQSYLVLRNELRDGRVSFADDFVPTREEWTVLEAQLVSIRTRPGTERVEDLVTKDEMRREGLKSPDRADSIAMQFATQAPTMLRSLPDDMGAFAVPSAAWSGYHGY